MTLKFRLSHERIDELVAYFEGWKPRPGSPVDDTVLGLKELSNRRAFEIGATQPKGDGWEDNAKYLLEHCPYAIRVREGNGPENLLSSLVLTFQKMQHKLTTEEGTV